jgi:ABC-type antimicrobial peptide transport system permease subunit
MGIDFSVVNIYDYSNIEVKYETTDSSTLYIPLDGSYTLDSYFANVFVTPNKVEKVTKELEARGFIVIYPLRNADADPLMKFLMEFLALIIVLEFGAYLIGIFFIVYVVLSKIYSSRTKDYEIIRTLGVTKNDMKKIVNIELILIGMVVSILAYFAFYGVVLSVDALSFLKYMNFGTFISYFFVMFMFSYFMAKRFNKRLFKFTVRKSMKGVHEDDQD